MSLRRSPSIRSWLILLVVGALLPLLLFSAWLAYLDYQRQKQSQLDELLNLSRALAQVVDREIEARRSTLRTLATAASLHNGDLRGFYDRARSVIAISHPETSITLAEEGGQLVLDTSLPFGDPLPRSQDMETLRAVFETGLPQVSNLYTDPANNQPRVGVAVPIMQDGDVAHELAMTLPLDVLQTVLSAQKLPESWVASVVDRNGVIIARNIDPAQWVGKPTAEALRASIETASEGYGGGTTVDGREVVSVWARSLGSGWSVVIGYPQSLLMASLARGIGAIALAWLLVLALALLIAALLSRRISHALSSLSNSAAAVGAGKKPKPPAPGIREVEDVGAALGNASRLLRERAAERNAAEEHLRWLVAELDHRVKNILASVQAIARQSFGQSPEQESFSGRLTALAKAHDLLAQSRWRGASLRTLAEITLSAHSDAAGERVAFAGPDVVLTPKMTQALSLALHELTTNAAKYGALSVPTGTVALNWRFGAGGKALKIAWRERGGPPVPQQVSKGFGSLLIERSLAYELGGAVELLFHTDGVECRIEFPLPAAPATPLRAPAKPAAPKRRPPAAALTGRRVLLVEDTALVGMEMRDVLTAAGIHVVGPVSSLEEALALARDGEMDAGILDINLDGNAVFPVADVLKTRGIPFVFLTGYGDPRVVPEPLRQVPRITKPARPNDILRALGVALHDAAGNNRRASR